MFAAIVLMTGTATLYPGLRDVLGLAPVELRGACMSVAALFIGAVWLEVLRFVLRASGRN
jgi:hypothetical protein